MGGYGDDGKWYGDENERIRVNSEIRQDEWRKATGNYGMDLILDNDARNRAEARAAEDRREAEREREAAINNAKSEEAEEAITQIFELYKAGKIDNAINLGLQCVRQKKNNEKFEEIVEYVAVMCYLNGRYQEAISCEDIFINCLSYEKLGEYDKATKELIRFQDVSGVGGEKHLSERANFYFLNRTFDTPFNIDIAEITPLIIERTEKGDKSFYKLMGDIYLIGQGVSQSDEKAKEYYEKGIDNNDKYALFQVSEFLFYGKSIYKKNKKLGMKYMKKAVSLKHPEAKEELRIFKMENLGFLGYRWADINSGFITFILTLLYSFSTVTMLIGIKIDFPTFLYNLKIGDLIAICVIPFILLLIVLKIFVKYRHAVVMIIFSLITLIWGIGVYNAKSTNWKKFFPTPIANIIKPYIPDEAAAKAKIKASAKTATARKDTALRSGREIANNNVIRNIKQGEILIIFADTRTDGWIQVIDEKDVEGWVQKRDFTIAKQQKTK
jgi:tetratricopeptide (TPR) repeat protein